MNIVAVSPILWSVAESEWFVSLNGNPNSEPPSVIEFGPDVDAAKDLVTYLAPRSGTRMLQLVVSRPPGPVSDFVEVENLRNEGVELSGWYERGDGHHVLFVRQAL
jgi:hypothetical protein